MTEKYMLIIYGIISTVVMSFEWLQILKLEQKLKIYKGDSVDMEKYVISIGREEIMTIKADNRKEAIKMADEKVPDWTHISR